MALCQIAWVIDFLKFFLQLKFDELPAFPVGRKI